MNEQPLTESDCQTLTEVLDVSLPSVKDDGQRRRVTGLRKKLADFGDGLRNRRYAAEHDAGQAIDTYLKDMTEEQRFLFDEWLKDELEAKRIPEIADGFTLKILARAWLSGWDRSRSHLVTEVHAL